MNLPFLEEGAFDHRGDFWMTEERAGLPIIAFADADVLDRWLERQPESSPGLWIKFAKAGTGIPSVTKTEATDAALCHGWIDGQLDKYDDQHWLVRFTPRKGRGKWSQVNRTRATRASFSVFSHVLLMLLILI